MEIVARASIMFVFLWLLTRSMGKRELAEMTAFELLLLVTVGDLIQQGVTQEDFSVTGGLLAVSTVALWIVLGSWASFRWKRVREMAEGVPVVVVRNGKPLKELLRIERVTMDELLESARQQGISDLADVEIGILEPDGRFAFIKSNSDERSTPERHQA